MAQELPGTGRAERRRPAANCSRGTWSLNAEVKDSRGTICFVLVWFLRMNILWISLTSRDKSLPLTPTQVTYEFLQI